MLPTELELSASITIRPAENAYGRCGISVSRTPLSLVAARNRKDLLLRVEINRQGRDRRTSRVRQNHREGARVRLARERREFKMCVIVSVGIATRSSRDGVEVAAVLAVVGNPEVAVFRPKRQNGALRALRLVDVNGGFVPPDVSVVVWARLRTGRRNGIGRRIMGRRWRSARAETRNERHCERDSYTTTHDR